MWGNATTKIGVLCAGPSLSLFLTLLSPSWLQGGPVTGFAKRLQTGRQCSLTTQVSRAFGCCCGGRERSFICPTVSRAGRLGLDIISNQRWILYLRTEFIYTTHNSLYAVKEFLSIVMLLPQTLVFSNLLYLLQKHPFHRDHRSNEAVSILPRSKHRTSWGEDASFGEAELRSRPLTPSTPIMFSG